MKKRWDYDVNIHVKSDVKSVKEGADTTERELTRTQRKLLEMENWLKKNAKLIEAAFKAAEVSARFSGQAFTEFQRMMSGLSAEVGKVKTSFDALKTSIEAAANAKRKFGNSTGTGGGGSGGANDVNISQFQKTVAQLQRINAQGNRAGNDIGKAIYQGINKGISGGSPSVQSSTFKLTNAAIATAKNSLGIRSPSTVFIGIGNFIVRGLAQGISAGTGIAKASIESVLSAVIITAQTAFDLGKQAVQLAADFQTTTNALAVFTGSTSLARKELADIDDLAANTAGLRLESAEEGYTRLRALGFQANLAKGIVKELGEEKILSGSSDESLQKVIYNFTQIASGGQKVSQELREILTQMPSMKRAFFDAFGTLDPQKIQTFFDKDTDAALQKLVDAMGRGEAAAGGFNDAFGKLSDAILKAGREFGEPLLDPLTEDTKVLTGLIEDNKNTWRDWGEDVAGIIRATRLVIENIPAPEKTDPNSLRGKINSATNYNLTDYFKGDDSAHSLFDYFVEYGKRDVAREQFEKNKKAFGVSTANIDRTSIDTFLDPKTNTLRFETEKEKNARLTALKDKLLQDLEKSKARELVLLKNTAAEAEAILKNRYEKEQTVIDLANRFTSQQEIEFLRRSDAAKINFIQSQIARQTGFFNKQIELQNGNDVEVQKLTSEKNKVLGDLNTELFTSSARTQKQIQDLENRIYEERRQAAIEYQNIIIQQVQAKTDAQTYAVQTALQNQTVSTEQNYKKLFDITKHSYFKIAQANREQLNLQLQDLSLTSEQRLNLILKGYLSEQKAAEDNARALNEIEKQRTAAALKEIQERTERQLKFISDYQTGANEFSIFGDVGGISSFNNFDSLLKKAKTLSDFFEDSNQKQAKFFKGQAEYYKALIPQSQEALERARRINESMLPTAPNASAFPSPTTNLATGEIIPQNSEVPDFDKRIADAGVTIAGMQAKIDQYINVAAQYNSLATQYEAYAKKSADTYGSLQAEVFNLYDSISKGIGNDTIFDQIIEKNYLAQRSFEKDSLETKVQGLLTQLNKAQEAVEDGSGTGLEVARIQSDLTQAEKALAAFNFQTDVGKEKLDTLANAAALFKKIIAGDVKTIEAIKFSGKQDLEKQKGGLAAENIILEQKYYQDSNLLALQRRNKILNYERDIFEIRQELTNKAVFNETEATAKILAHIEQSTTSASDLFANAFIDAFDRISGKMDSFYDKFGVGKIPIIGDIVKAQSRNILGAISQNLFGDLFGDIGNSNNPILNENQKQTKSLQNIEKAVTGVGSLTNIGGGSTSSNGSGGGIAGLFKKFISIFTGNRGGGSSSATQAAAVNSNSPLVGASQVLTSDPVIQGIMNGSIQMPDYRNGGSIVPPTGTINAAGEFVVNGNQSGGSGNPLSSLVSGQGGLSALIAGGLPALAISSFIASTQTKSPLKGLLMGGLVGLGFGFLNRSRLRKKEEKIRTQSLLDAFAAIDKLIASVNENPDFSDAQGVINQGETIRQSYLDSANALKDKKTRNIALKDVSRIDAKLRELETLAKAKAAKTKSRAESLVADIPTFSDGGAVSNFISGAYQNNPLGYISGPGSSRSDSILARISNGEFIVNAAAVRAVGVANLEKLNKSQGRLKYMFEPQMKFADGGAVGMISTSSQSSGGDNSAIEQPPKIETHIYIQKTGDQTESVKSETYWTSSEGKRMLIDTVEQEIDRNGSDSKVYRAISRARKRYGD